MVPLRAERALPSPRPSVARPESLSPLPCELPEDGASQAWAPTVGEGQPRAGQAPQVTQKLESGAESSKPQCGQGSLPHRPRESRSGNSSRKAR